MQWKVLGSHWNGASLLIIPQTTPQVMLTSDASGLWGCGAWSGSDHGYMTCSVSYIYGQTGSSYNGTSRQHPADHDKRAVTDSDYSCHLVQFLVWSSGGLSV